MKKWVGLSLLLCLVSALPSFGQASNSLPFTAVTSPPPPVLTSLTGLSASGKIYTGSKMPIIGTGFTAGCVVNVDGVAQPASTFAFVSSTEIDYTIPASAGSSAGASHTLTVSCTAPVLTMNSPVALPNGQVGTTYSSSLPLMSKITGGIPPYTWTLSSGSLPMGLTLSPSGAITGTPSSPGSFNFTATASDSSGLAIHQKPLIVQIAKSLVAKL